MKRSFTILLGAILAVALCVLLALRRYPLPDARPSVTLDRKVYGDAPSEWSELFDRCTTVQFSALRLRQDSADPSILIKEYLHGKRKQFISRQDFEPKSIPVVLRGETEWSPIVAGPRHVLLSPTYESLLEVIGRISNRSGEWRSRVDLLALARFQNDLLMALRSVAFFGSWESYDLRSDGIDKQGRSERLQEALNGLLEKTFLTEDEIAALPDTHDLNLIKALCPDWDYRYLYWLDLPTEHENATLECIQNEVLVSFPKDRASLFDQDKVHGYIRTGRWPKVDCVYFLLDQLLVFDRNGKIRKTPVTVEVRTARFFENPQNVLEESRFGDFDVYLLRRRAHAAEWGRDVVRLGPDETGGAMVDLPNIPGFLKPYYQVPLKLTCIQCHEGRPRFLDPTNDQDPDEVVKRFYVGPRPRRGRS